MFEFQPRRLQSARGQGDRTAASAAHAAYWINADLFTPPVESRPRHTPHHTTSHKHTSVCCRDMYVYGAHASVSKKSLSLFWR